MDIGVFEKKITNKGKQKINKYALGMGVLVMMV
jgi:hypothetical protein